MRDAGWVVPAPPRIPHPASRIPLMLNVALTGNIAAGKSTVVDLFRRWGATIIDADVLVREAQAPGGEVLAAIAGRFGADVLASDGTLDRAAPRGKVMGDQAALDALNQIVHPAVRRRRDELLREAQEGGDLLVGNDIPLLFEAVSPCRPTRWSRPPEPRRPRSRRGAARAVRACSPPSPTTPTPSRYASISGRGAPAGCCWSSPTRRAWRRAPICFQLPTCCLDRT